MELRHGAWTPVSEPLIPEPRQPFAGFSRELRLLEDCQRFYFTHSINRRGRLPVHILFSRSAEQAEVTTGDMKPLRIAPVRSVVEARRRWIEWFDPFRSKGGGARKLFDRLGLTSRQPPDGGPFIARSHNPTLGPPIVAQRELR